MFFSKKLAPVIEVKTTFLGNLGKGLNNVAFAAGKAVAATGIVVLEVATAAAEVTEKARVAKAADDAKELTMETELALFRAKRYGISITTTGSSSTDVFAAYIAADKAACEAEVLADRFSYSTVYSSKAKVLRKQADGLLALVKR